MPDYKNGKVYAIRNTENDSVYIGSTTQPLSKRMSSHRGNVNRRITKLYNMMNEIGIDKFYIELIENYPCNNKEELFAREGYFIREYDSFKNGYNGVIAGRSDKEYREDNKEKRKEYYENNKEKIKEYRENNKEKRKEYIKEYYENNKDKIKEKKKEYYENNQEKIKEKVKEYYENNKEKKKENWKTYYEDNKEKIKEYIKEYRENNKEKIKEYKKENWKTYYESNKEKIKEKITCECGSIVSKNHLSRHIKTIKHQDYMNNKTSTS